MNAMRMACLKEMIMIMAIALHDFGIVATDIVDRTGSLFTLSR